MTVPPHPRGYVCVRSPHPIKLTGKLDDEAWKLARWSEEFVDIEGKPALKPWYKTRVKMLWDDEFLYIGAELEEKHLWATLTEHDSVIFHDNDFEVFIDPDGDNHQYYEYEINAFGTDWDLRLVKPYRDGGPALNEWEIQGLKKAVHLDGTINEPGDADRKWSLELAFPWKVLGEYANCPSPPHPGDQWRINFSRVQWDLRIKDGTYEKIPDHPEHNWVWSPQGAIDMHRPEMWGYLQFENENVPFVPDPDWAYKCALMDIYWAQKEHHRTQGAYAETLEDLGVNHPNASLALTATGYLASIQSKRGLVTVREDSLLIAAR